MDQAVTPDAVMVERERIRAEYERRAREVNHAIYSPWDAAELLARNERRFVAARALVALGATPGPGDRCLEIGYGTLGWLADLLTWGVPATCVSGIELDPGRARAAQQLLPDADLRIGDANELPWDAGAFQLVIASTVFSSVLDPAVQRQMAGEISRVLRPGGALVWYDMAVRNPWNPNVRPVSRRAIRSLFPGLAGPIRSVTLAPMMARRIAPVSPVGAALLGAVPLLRTHLLAVLQKPAP
jgi:ubiquinone/menaquinone biosynthesis C-methylase UbiE